MSRFVSTLLMLVAVVAVGRSVCHAGDDMVDNPKYKFWSSFKPGATSTYTQTTRYHGPEKSSFPGGVETKTIVYRLANVTKDAVVVVTTVVEEDFLGTVESAPTKMTFPAKVKKANLAAFLNEWNAKEAADEMIKVGDKQVACKVRSGSHKVEGGTVDAKICFADSVPGGIVSHTRTTKEGAALVAETTTTLVSFAEMAKKKTPQ